MDYFTALLTRFFSILIGILPFWILYGISDVLRFLLLHVFGYRKKVVVDNLKSCFPEKNDEEIKRLVKLSYKNLADVTVESFKGFTMSERQIVARHKGINAESVSDYFKNGRSIIFLPNHYGNWEWGSLSPAPQLKQNIVVLYKPLANKYLDRYVRKNRSRTGSFLGSIYNTARIFREYQDVVSAYILASDQSPSNAKRSIWVKFLGRDTAFLHGPELYARKYDMPVIFVDIQRVKRGFYTMEFSVITDKPKEHKPGEITALYAKKLESVIRAKPENWLWSHRRWKLTKPE